MGWSSNLFWLAPKFDLSSLPSDAVSLSVGPTQAVSSGFAWGLAEVLVVVWREVG